MRFSTRGRGLRIILQLVTSALSVRSLDIFVDDAYPNITYSPSSQWFQGATCGTSCAIRPHAPSVHDGTWHYATYDPTQDSIPPSITFKFKATTIAVRNILPPLVTTAPTSDVQMAFELDGADTVPFRYSPAGDAVFTYGAVVFSNNSLAYTEHTLVITIPLGQASVVLFDCFELTVPDPPTQAPPTTSSGSALSSTLTSSASAVSTLPPSITPEPLPPFATPSSSKFLSSSSAVPAPPPVASSDSKPLNRTAIGGAVGGGVFVIVLAATLCFLRWRRARRYPTPVEALEPAHLGGSILHGGSPSPIPDPSDEAVAPSDPQAVLLASTREPSQFRSLRSPPLTNFNGKSWLASGGHPRTSPRRRPPSPPVFAGGLESGSGLSTPHGALRRTIGSTATSPLGEQLAAQLTALREEVSLMRQQRRGEGELLEPPPRYDEA